MENIKKLKQAWVLRVRRKNASGDDAVFIPHAVCEMRSTAHRLSHKEDVLGNHTSIMRDDILLYNGYIYGPVTIVRPSNDDRLAQEKMDAADAAKVKALAAGLTFDDIEALKH